MVDHRESVVDRRRVAMLPGLLSMVRRRRRRRHITRAIAAVVTMVAVAMSLRAAFGREDHERLRAVRDEPRWSVIRDDPRVLDRVRAPTVVRAEWFVDDDGLRRLLDGAARPSGTVRTRGQVFVAAGAIDPFIASGS